jgi:hypothetical protein
MKPLRVVGSLVVGVKLSNLQLDKLRLDGGTHLRKNDAVVVANYRARLPSIITDTVDVLRPMVFFDGTDYWLADGFDRHEAHVLEGETRMLCQVRRGTVRDAILHAVGCNVGQGYGRERTHDGLVAIINMMLRDPEWVRESDRWIADACHTQDRQLVADLRRAISGDSHQMRRVRRKGQVYDLDASNLSAKETLEEIEAEPEFEELPPGAQAEIRKAKAKRSKEQVPTCRTCGQPCQHCQAKIDDA